MDYKAADFSSPLYYLEHKKHGKHLLFSTHAATEENNFAMLNDMHPILQKVIFYL